MFPGANGGEAWIAAARDGRVALTDAPAGRWPVDAHTLLDPRPGTPDRTPTIRGGYVEDDVPFDAAGLDLADVPVAAMDPLFRWVLRVVGGVVGPRRDRVDLLLANLSFPSTGAVDAVASAYGLPRIRPGGSPHDRWSADRPALLAAHAFGLEGHVTALDAACASGLYAVSLAVDRLLAGRCDEAIAAAVNRADSAFLGLGFAQLRALSATGVPRPFDRRADGLLVGEGAAAVRLKRLDDALRDGDVIHAVIRGHGLGNDGKKGNLLAPSATGQLRTLRAAWAGFDPASMGLVECHATGTPLGDKVEVEALAALVGPGATIALSSSKALVGHTVTAAGLAGLIRAVGAVRDGFLPPIPCDEPIEALGGRFRVPTQPEAWPDERRRAGVSAFGFGGTNAHLIVERYVDAASAWAAPPADPHLAVVAAAAHIGKADEAAVRAALAGGPSLVEAGDSRPDGAYVDAVAVDAARWRVPPAELAGWLPQQALLLDVAARALAGCDLPPHRIGAVVGMGIDLAVAAHTLRVVALGDGRDGDTIAPALDAARVQGVLPNFVANRLSAHLGLEGPTYTVSAGPLSGLAALDHAARLLAADVVDAVLVGAVDLPGDDGVAGLAAAAGRAPIGEGAVALLVRRARDVEGIATIGPVDWSRGEAPATRVEQVGDLDAAAGLVAVLAAVWGTGPATVRVGAFPGRVGTVGVIGTGAPTPAIAAVKLAVPVVVRRRRIARAKAAARLPASRPRTQPVARIRFEGEVSTTFAPLSWRPAAPSRTATADARTATAPARPATAPARTATAPARTATPAALPATAPARPATPAARTATVPVRPETAAARPATPQAPPATAAARPATGAPLPATAPPRPATAPPPAETPPTRPATPPAPSVGAATVSAPAPGRRPDRVSIAVQEAAGIAELAAGITRGQSAVATAHAAFLAGRVAGEGPLRQLGAWLSEATTAALAGAPGWEAATEAPVAWTPTAEAPVAPVAPAPTGPKRTYGIDELRRFAGGKLSEALGPAYADLDRFEPRTRLPLDPLLLVSRVVDLDGERGRLGPARIVTEYDIPADQYGAHDGKAPPCVVVESGQADLFLVSVLGIEATCRGERVYRLLDCDLTFHGDRPALGETLRHDIRIKRFARLGDKVLFYFEYDCTAVGDGRAVLTMREGVAGFFTPAELATPQGIARPDPTAPRPALRPRIAGAPGALDERAVSALEAGSYGEALGPAFAAADGGRLRLPKAPWRVAHRVPLLRLSGGPHGLGEVIVEQDLRDDDWFNACHFLGDPCMPGTLMFDGCVQALSIWLMGMGFPVDFPDATFEPIAGVAARLRCRGQVVPGHSLLTYEVRPKDAGLEPTPWVIADVVLVVDGTPVVVAFDVSLRISGERRVAPEREAVDAARVMEYSVGDPSKAFGPAFLPYVSEKRTARMPGPPFLTMTRVTGVDGPAGVLAAQKSATIAWDVPARDWWWTASPGTTMPFAMLTEAVLQPCGWLTAWQHSAIHAGEDVYFRNLGGWCEVHAPIPPDIGTLSTTTTQTSVSRSGGMILDSFRFECRAGDRLVATGESQFGYFTAASLANQKGLTITDEPPRAEARARGAIDEDLASLPVEPGLRPRSDLRMLSRLVAADPTGGKAGLGFYAATYKVDPKSWFFVAHFHQDPVMPGSLGLEGLGQLAREAWLRVRGPIPAGATVEVGASGTRCTWKYRGQVWPHRREVAYEIDIVRFEGDELVFDGLVRGDGLPIYTLDGLTIRVVPATSAAMARPQRDRVAALIDTFTASGATGRGILRLDPATDPWLADHAPTVAIPALPMAFAAEIAAEAAMLMVPGRRVVAVPTLEARKWIHTGEGPFDLHIDATVRGDEVDVTLSVWTENLRFPKLSGPVVHMAATVRLGEAWAPAEPAPTVVVGPSPWSAREIYDGGHTFHGPALQAMHTLDGVSDRAATAVFRASADADVLPAGAPGFVLDPVLLDTATHPMLSGQPEHWVPGLPRPSGKLAYPVRADGMRFFGPRPEGDVRCVVALVEGTPERLVFDVWLGGDAPWCAFRWTEALVEGGPVLGHPAEARRPFIWERRADPAIRIGRADGDGWSVAWADLVEPIPGTLARLLCTPTELAVQGDDLVARLAAKEAARSWVQAKLGFDVHPSALGLLRLRDDRFVLVESAALTAQQFIDALGPTRFVIRVEAGPKAARAWVVPTAP